MFDLVIIAAVLAFLNGCGTAGEPETVDMRTVLRANKPSTDLYIHPDFVDTVNQFAEDCPNADFSQIHSIRYAAIQDAQHQFRIGTCYFGDSIQILDTLESAPYDPIIMRALLYHELGHCVLGLEHSDTGMMEPYLDVEAPAYYDTHWNELVTGMCGSK